MLLQGEGFRGMLQGGGANRDPSAPPAWQRWACGMLRVTPPPPPWGRNPPAGRPFFRVCKAGALFFPETRWEARFGVPPSPHCFGGGLIPYPVPWDRAVSARQEVLLQFWVLLAQEGRSRGHRTWREGQQLVQPWRWGFQAAQRSAGIKLPQCRSIQIFHQEPHKTTSEGINGFSFIRWFRW